MCSDVSDVFSQGLISLRCLIWPELPQLAQLTLQRHAPQLRIVDAKDSGPALDEPYARQVAQYDWAAALQRREASQACSGSGAGGVREQQREMPAGSSSAVISLADRFRCARAFACNYVLMRSASVLLLQSDLGHDCC